MLDLNPTQKTIQGLVYGLVGLPKTIDKFCAVRRTSWLGSSFDWIMVLEGSKDVSFEDERCIKGAKYRPIDWRYMGWRMSMERWSPVPMLPY